jgi:AraC-like DNA-binding protein
MATSARPRTALLEAILAYVEDAAGARGVGMAGSGGGEGAGAPRRPLHLGGIASLLAAAAPMLEDEAIGLHFAAGFDFDALGPFAYAVLHAPTLGTALRNLERYSDAVTVDARLHLEVDGGSAMLHFPVWGRGPASVFRHIDEAAVVFVLRMLRRLTGPGWSPREIAFRHPEPSDLGAHRRLLGGALRFARPSTRIVLASADLDRPVRDADRVRLPIVERHLEDVVSEHADPDPWRHELELQVASLVCDGHPSIRTIAPLLGMSARTLQRRLDERGLRYRDLVAGVRMRMARHYLDEGLVGLGEIAFLLGYSELSAFDRAFRRWMGMSPGEYRRRTDEGDPIPSRATRRRRVAPRSVHARRGRVSSGSAGRSVR